jgi:hypothetical protein
MVRKNRYYFPIAHMYLYMSIIYLLIYSDIYIYIYTQIYMYDGDKFYMNKNSQPSVSLGMGIGSITERIPKSEGGKVFFIKWHAICI